MNLEDLYREINQIKRMVSKILSEEQREELIKEDEKHYKVQIKLYEKALEEVKKNNFINKEVD